MAVGITALYIPQFSGWVASVERGKGTDGEKEKKSGVLANGERLQSPVTLHSSDFGRTTRGRGNTTAAAFCAFIEERLLEGGQAGRRMTQVLAHGSWGTEVSGFSLWDS